MSVAIPQNFDGTKFAAKYTLAYDAFYIDGNQLFSPVPNLTEADLLDCVVTPAELAELEAQEQGLQQFKAAYLAAITRLNQIQNAGAIPFTQAGFNQVVQAVKDIALYVEQLAKIAKRDHK